MDLHPLLFLQLDCVERYFMGVQVLVEIEICLTHQYWENCCLKKL